MEISSANFKHLGGTVDMTGLRRRGRPRHKAAVRVTVPLCPVREVRLYERDVHLRMPFRFGVVTLTEAPQCFVRVRIELADGRSQWGGAAELLAPKWFDKNLALSNEDNFDQLRLSLAARGRCLYRRQGTNGVRPFRRAL